jgi:hypothetical protein
LQIQDGLDQYETALINVAFRAYRVRYFQDESGENGTKWGIVVWKD